MKIYPLKFEPQLQYRIWGGKKLSSDWGKAQRDEPIGESWEISAVPGNESVVANGTYAGKNLNEISALLQKDLLGEKYTTFPLLIKFLDATTPLSVQVHPNDEWAQKRHNSLGKTEMWYVLEADQGAENIIGFLPGTTQEKYTEAVANNTIESILQRIPVKKGDVFFLPAGRVHAIGAGIVLAEIQQSSDVTYRIYDYNRIEKNGKPRELHTEQAKDVIDFSPVADPKNPKFDAPTLVKCPYFEVEKYTAEPQHFVTKSDSFEVVICVDGAGSLRYPNEKEMPIRKGESLLIPSALGSYSVSGVEFLRVRV